MTVAVRYVCVGRLPDNAVCIIVMVPDMFKSWFSNDELWCTTFFSGARIFLYSSQGVGKDKQNTDNSTPPKPPPPPLGIVRTGKVRSGTRGRPWSRRASGRRRTTTSSRRPLSRAGRGAAERRSTARRSTLELGWRSMCTTSMQLPDYCRCAGCSPLKKTVLASSAS